MFTITQATNFIRLRITDDDGGVTTIVVPVNFGAAPPPPQGSVQAVRIFYNNSFFDGNTPAGLPGDAAAIDPNKVPNVPGSGPTNINNIIGDKDGITGIIVDGNFPGTLTAADFLIRRGTTSNINTWAVGAAPTVLFLPGGGPGGVDRAILTWPDDTFVDTYVAITVLANANTDLAAPSTSVYGSVAGDAGASLLNPVTHAGRAAEDIAAAVARFFQLQGGQMTTVDDMTDTTKDGFVNASDFQATITGGTSGQLNEDIKINQTVLQFLTLGFAAVPAPGFAAAAFDASLADSSVEQAASLLPPADSSSSTGSQDGRVGSTSDDDRDLAFASLDDEGDVSMDDDLLDLLAGGLTS
jgi:hypothetical protein